MAEEVESDVITENTTEMEEKIEYPLDVKYCGGNLYLFSVFCSRESYVFIEGMFERVFLFFYFIFAPLKSNLSFDCHVTTRYSVQFTFGGKISFSSSKWFCFSFNFCSPWQVLIYVQL